MTEQSPTAIYTGQQQDGRRVLVTIWNDRAEITYRGNESATWDEPTFLQRMGDQ